VKKTSSTKVSFSNIDGANRLAGGLGGKQKAYLLSVDRLVEEEDVILNSNVK